MKRLLPIAVLLLALPAMASPNSKIKLAWDPVQYNPATGVTGLAGYNVNSGVTSGQYDRVDFALGTNLELTDMPACEDRYYAISAVGNNNLEGPASSEVVGWPRPFVATATCETSGSVISPGTWNCSLVGNNIKPDASLVVYTLPEQVAQPVVSGVQVTGCTGVTFTLNAPVYPTDVQLTLRVINPDSGFGTPFGGRPGALTLETESVAVPLAPANPRRGDTVAAEGSDPNAGAGVHHHSPMLRWAWRKDD